MNRKYGNFNTSNNQQQTSKANTKKQPQKTETLTKSQLLAESSS